MVEEQRVSASFRDPSGFVFERNGLVFRQVNRFYQDHYDRLMASGLYQRLSSDGLLVAHEEVDEAPMVEDGAYKILRPERIPFISYPYEWCFGQLKAAALLTLEIQKRALEAGMSLKDASAYNVQFLGGRAVFLDTLSFETYREGEPWPAYRQFCQHFLAPLLLMSQVDVRLSQLLRSNLDGIPLDLAASLLPWKSRLRLGPLIHIHLHSKSQRHFGQASEPTRRRRFTRTSMLGLIESLEASIRGLDWSPEGTEWADYYQDTNYTDAAREQKRRFVADCLDRTRPATVWDLGANTGVFSRLASDRGIPTVAFDIDPACVERSYRDASSRGEALLLPLQMDLSNPSPALGWRNRERMSLIERGPTDLALALALIHHLAISNNVPLRDIAEFFQRICQQLVIEFVPKEDSQVRRILVARADVFEQYSQARFEEAFGAFFEVERREAIQDSGRMIYHFRKR